MLFSHQVFRRGQFLNPLKAYSKDQWSRLFSHKDKENNYIALDISVTLAYGNLMEKMHYFKEMLMFY